MKLIEKLVQRNVPMCFVRLLEHWYIEQTMQIKRGKHLSVPFQGWTKGSVESIFVFCIFGWFIYWTKQH